MLRPDTLLEDVKKKCKTLDDLRNLMNQCEFKENEENIEIPQELLQEAVLKTKHLKNVKVSEIQKALRVGYPLASRIRKEMEKKG